MPTWYVPANAIADAALDDAWRRLAGEHTGSPHELVVKGHIVRVPKAAMGVARFSFDDLCAQPLAATDYLKIAHEFHTVVLDRIPPDRDALAILSRPAAWPAPGARPEMVG
jgi:cell division protein ZapE